MGITAAQVDEILSPYVEKAYNYHHQETARKVRRVVGIDAPLDTEAIHNEAMECTYKELKQGFQAMEIAFNTLSSSRGDFVFVTYSFGLGQDKWSQMVCRAMLEVRAKGQGEKGKEKPCLFPKLVYLFDHELHGEGKLLRDSFVFAVETQANTMFPDFVSLTGHGEPNSIQEIYKNYGVATSPMGCRSYLSPYYEKGGFKPLDENDKPVAVSRGNAGVISLNIPFIYSYAKRDGIDFYELLDKYLNMALRLHLRTKQFLGEKRASTHPLAYCYGGFHNGFLNPNDKIAPVLESFTYSIGVTALHELSILHTGKSIFEDNTFAKEVVDYINKRCDEYKYENNIMVSTYGVPAESYIKTQVEQYRREFGIVEDVSDKDYFNNSHHVAVDTNCTQIEKQDAEFELFHKLQGGRIMYNRVNTKKNLQANIALVERAMDLGYYYGINFNNVYCDECGHNNELGNTTSCDKCGSTKLTQIDRVSGYLGYSKIGGDTRINEAKLAEIEACVCR